MAMKIQPIVVRKKSHIGLWLLVLLGVILFVAAIYYFITLNDTQDERLQAVKQAVIPQPDLPNGWERFTSNEYGFSIGYPADYSPHPNQVRISTVETASDKVGFGVTFQKSNETDLSLEFAPIEVRATHQTLAQAVAGRKAIAAESGNRVTTKSQIVHESTLLIAGHPATRLDELDIDQTSEIGQAKAARQPDVYRTFVFVEVNDLTYALQTTWQQKGDYESAIAQQMVATFAVIDKS